MIDVFAYIGGIFAMISFIPQITKSIKTKSTSDLSWMMLLTTLVSVSAYEVYAFSLELVPVYIMNGILLVTVLLLMGIKYRFDGRY